MNQTVETTSKLESGTEITPTTVHCIFKYLGLLFLILSTSSTIALGCLAFSIDDQVYTTGSLFLPFWISLITIIWSLVLVTLSLGMTSFKLFCCSSVFLHRFWTLMCLFQIAAAFICLVLFSVVKDTPGIQLLFTLLILICGANLYFGRGLKTVAPRSNLAIRVWNWFLLFLAFASCCILLLFAINGSGRVAASSATKPPGALYSVYDAKFKLHLYCKGASVNNTKILLEPGLGEASMFFFTPIMDTLTAMTRVCIYDRPGYAFSESGPSNATASKVVESLVEALTQAEENGPFILLSHSLGGLYGVYLAAKYPNLVNGMVMLDSTSPDTMQNAANSFKITLSAFIDISAVYYKMLAVIVAPFGGEFLAYNSLVNANSVVDDLGVAIPIQYSLMASILNGRQWQAAYREVVNVVTTSEEVSEVKDKAKASNGGRYPLNNIPISVISAGVNYNSTCDKVKALNAMIYPDCDSLAAAQASWRDEQHRLFLMSANPKNTEDVVADSPHNVLYYPQGRKITIQRLKEMISML